MRMPQRTKWTTRSAPVALLAIAIGLGAAAPASAITVTSTGISVSVFDDRDEPNALTVARDGADLLLSDTAATVDVVAPCTQDDPAGHRARCPTGDVGAIEIDLAGADDELLLGDALQPTAAPRALVISVGGGAGSDTLRGGDQAEDLNGGTGSDRILGGAGDDTIGGGTGDGGGPDGDDVLDGGPGNEQILGEAGDDTIIGGPGDDLDLDGGPGDDDLDGGPGADAVFGGPGSDGVRGGEGADALDLVTLAPDLARVAGDDRLDGGPGDDRLSGGPDATTGGDVLAGGEGNDLADYGPRTRPVTVVLDGTADDGETGERDDVKPDVESVAGGANGDTLIGTPGPDVLDGGSGDDLILGLAGADVLRGGDGDPGSDRLEGGPGADVITGGPGDDSAVGDDDDDRVSGDGGSDAVAGGAGQDEVAGGAGPDEVAGGDGDDVLLGGARVLVGNDGDDRLAGDAGSDTLLAGAGDDVLDGGPGPDRMSGEAGRDAVTYETRSAPVSVSFDGVANDGEAGEGDDVAADVEIVRAGARQDTLAGNDDRNDLRGAGGEDLIDGRLGADLLDGGADADVLRARDGVPDVVACGPGRDLAVLDPQDTARDCEFIDRGNRSAKGLGSGSLVRAAAGRVFLRLPGATRFVDLADATWLPARVTLDARNGRVRLRSRARGSSQQAASFWGGRFDVHRVPGRGGRGGRAPLTELRLRGGDFGACARLPATHVVRYVWGKGRGRFRTRGGHSSGVVRGTTWLTQDRCDGTLTRVRTGVVRVHTFGRDGSVDVRPGDAFLARRPGVRP